MPSIAIFLVVGLNVGFGVGFTVGPLRAVGLIVVFNVGFDVLGFTVVLGFEAEGFIVGFDALLAVGLVVFVEVDGRSVGWAVGVVL